MYLIQLKTELHTTLKTFILNPFAMLLTAFSYLLGPAIASLCWFFILRHSVISAWGRGYEQGCSDTRKIVSNI